MKKIGVLFTFLAFSFIGFSQSVGINTTGANPDPSALLDVVSTEKGMLVPRMDSLQRKAISSPALGLLVFDVDYNSFWFYNGVTWSNIQAGNHITDNDNDTRVEVEQLADEDKIRFSTGGYEVAFLDTKTFQLGASDGSVFIGKGAGKNDDGNTNASIALGTNALRNNESGVSNIGIGAHTLYNSIDKGDNTAVGDSNLYFNSIGHYKTTHGSNNTAIGSKSQVYNTIGAENTSTGSHALYSNTEGSTNSAVGAFALRSNTIGSHNSALGARSLISNTTGFANTALGSRALEDNIDGDNNTAIGVYALQENLTGGSNNSVGYYAQQKNKVGNFNNAFGNYALYRNTTGSHNSAFGQDALNNNRADYNNAFGDRALYKNTTGTDNVAIGHRALHENTTISQLVAVGDSALFFNGVGASGDDGTQNTAIGSKALKTNDVGKLNTAVGSNTLTSNEYGNSNTGMGAQTLQFNYGGTSNSAVGTYALQNNYNGSSNTAIGYASLNKNTSGNKNTAIGYLASQDNVNGLNNVTMGYSADANNVSGNFNTIIGYQAGRYNQAHSKSGNIFLGYQAGYNEIMDNKLYIENSNSTTPLIYGDFATDYLQINGELNVNDAYSFPNLDGTNNQILTTDGAGNAFWSDKTTQFWIEGTNSDLYYSDGMIGIGTNSPTSLLHLSTTTSMTEIVDFTGGTLGANDDLLNLTIAANSSNTSQIIECNNGNDNVFVVNGNGQTAIGDINIASGYMLTVGEGSNGNGIHVVGDSKFTQESGSENILEIIPANTTLSIGNSGVRMSADKNSVSAYVMQNDSADFTVVHEALGNEFERIRIDNFGRIDFNGGDFVMNPDVSGNSRFITDEIEIRGGSDLSEHFDVSDSENIVKPGMIVSIDPLNAGKMTIANKAYDKKVAGIISGANGIKTGVFMGQKGTIADGQYPIALTGRVYVYASDEGGPIQPGDFLTTSSTPGYAMKTTDFNKAQGAIVGKAMTAPSKEGFVLVLVNLQ
ncbi:MAG: hypothetical protein P1U56_25130 [Saprospiraceae bacterium]|nr:hypothetical protein [Saprospiraceae bacterium]